ncbi:MAG: hypothetical protein R3E63_02355 [Pseudomonadales bacterium]
MKVVDALKGSLLLRIVSGYGAIFFAVFLLIGVFLVARVEWLVGSTIDTYGTTVAEQLAQNSLDAAIQRDQVGLQAQLARLMKVPSVVSVSIYDASNALLAQAGATPSELSQRHFLRSYTATLGFGDNMTGSVNVILEVEKIESLLPEIRWALATLFVASFVALLMLSYYFTRDIRQQRNALATVLMERVPVEVMETCFSSRPSNLSEHEMRQLMEHLQQYVLQIQTPSPAELHEAAASLFDGRGGYVYLLLECHNIDVLQRQVSRDRLRVLLDQVQEQVKKTTRLYHAQRMPAAGSCIKIVFPVDAPVAEVLLRAACCADVLCNVLQACRDDELGIQLQWSLALDHHSPCDNDILRNRQQTTDEQRSRWLCNQVGNAQLAVSAEVGELLQAQENLTLAVEHGEGGKSFCRITAFAQQHRNLLDSQIARLLER